MEMRFSRKAMIQSIAVLSVAPQPHHKWLHVFVFSQMDANGYNFVDVLGQNHHTGLETVNREPFLFRFQQGEN